jgi:hypothetical protein
VARRFNYLVTEQYVGNAGTINEGYRVFPARFGNIYTSRQLIQLFERAYGLLRPKTDYWIGKGGEFIDPFRPRVQHLGFSSLEFLHADRDRHLAAVREMFESCSVFIFTLGLTETWLARADGCALPLAPGVVVMDTHDK